MNSPQDEHDKILDIARRHLALRFDLQSKQGLPPGPIYDSPPGPVWSVLVSDPSSSHVGASRYLIVSLHPPEVLRDVVVGE